MRMSTYRITYTYVGGETEDMHHDDWSRERAFQWAAIEGMEQVKYYPHLVASIAVVAVG